MARLTNDTAQWIVLMGFIVSFSLFFLAVLLNQSTVVGQTTAEAVSEFPKEDIRGVRSVIIESAYLDDAGFNNRVNVKSDIENLALARQNAVVRYSAVTDVNRTYFNIHYNNGVSAYNESWTYTFGI